ncbi:MAG: winged helix-turn-helix transcriptional regulator [Microbacteriaceae bacterium]
MAARDYGQYCGVSTALELVGERWALLIVRDLQNGGIIRRAPLAHRGVVYELTDYGRQLDDIVLALSRFGGQALGNLGGDDIVLALSRFGGQALGNLGGDDILTADALIIALRASFRPDVAASLPRTIYVLRLNDIALGLIAGPTLEVAPLPGTSRTPAPAGFDPVAAGVDLDLEVDHRIHHLLAGALSSSGALTSGAVRVRIGDPALVERFAATFSA